MRTNRLIAITISLAAMMVWMIAGCGGRSFEYTPPDEIKPGPGVFSGEEGEFTLYNSKNGAGKKKTTTDAQSPKAAEATIGASAAASSDTDTAEFQEFQQWKNEKKAFEEFQRWKKSAQGSKEYREFQQWQKWREYENWKKSQQTGN